MRTRVKICGLTRPDDVMEAVEAGADACGFVFASSPRQVTIRQAAKLAGLVPPPVTRIGVFVDAAPDFVAEAVAECGLTAVQFCGDETAGIVAKTRAPVIKVLKVGTGFSLEEAEPFRDLAAAYLLDTYSDCKAGGTSQIFGWRSIGEVPGWAPFFVAGGLTPENVGEAIAALHPFAVDVSSGVESSPGIKDKSKIRAFVDAVRVADEEGVS